ncbi:MAG: AhpC/TSA family protein [Bacteroidales bacterium]|jgi:cytochrome oxidase Cu insertion factor (SCO1/SenC/PrrC family)|nr:AhpC/TSA family protein [Bacteroidales bacterium]
MNKFISWVLLAAAITGCRNEEKVTIRGTFAEGKEGIVYLDQSDVSTNILIDSAEIKRGQFRFTAEITGPEFFQVRIGRDDFVGLLAMPGEEISLTFGSSPLVMNYEVEGSPGSLKIKELDQKLFITVSGLDSLKKIYASLTEEELAVRGPALEASYLEIVEAQRKNNISFILSNLTSMAAVKAVYQRLDENAYVLYQPRDLQFLKIVSDSLSVKYPASRHVIALKENVTSELNQMYINRLAAIAAQSPISGNNPQLPDTEGKTVALSSLRGKYVLVSFWATTSEECIAELESLKSIYALYKPRGLEIYQISLDASEERWKNVVRFEEIPWISVREPDPSNPVYARAMGITTVPANLLYDPDGNIINTNLFGRNLQIRMDQIFNK